MNKFIKLKGLDGQTIIANVPQIACVVQNMDEVDGCTVYFAGGASMAVAEPAKSVLEKAST
jgi:hypothetical protein